MTTTPVPTERFDSMTTPAAISRPGTGLRVWLAPPFTAFVFLIHFVVTACRPASVFSDPGTGWHLMTGRYILETGSIPRQDVFSFTAAGRPWISYAWLFEAASAGLARIGGLPLFGGVATVVYALIPVLVFRRCLRLGASLIPALGTTTLAYLVLTSHALARPHIFTYLLFAITLEILGDVQDGRRPVRSLVWLAPLAALWSNIHSGFVVALTLAGLYAAVALFRGWLLGDRAEWRRGLAFGAAMGAMAAATLVNPSGPWLHLEIVHHLGMSATRYFGEFQSPDFTFRHVSMFSFEVLILLVVVAVARGTVAWVDVLVCVFFIHEGLESVRHMNLFAIVAAPIIARELSAPFGAFLPRVAARCREIVAEQTALRSAVVYFPAFAAAFVVLSALRVVPFPTTLDGIQLSRDAAEFIGQHQADFGRAFNTDELGGPLIYRFWPDLRIFVDDRISIYGDDFITKDYFTVLYGKTGWQDVLDRYELTAAAVSVDRPCTQLLRASPDWKVVFEDDKNVLFERASDARMQQGTAPARIATCAM
jgi:hypothetical protein